MIMHLPLIADPAIARSNGSSNSNRKDGSCFKTNLKFFSVAVLFFVGGMQFDHDSIMRMNFNSRSPPQTAIYSAKSSDVAARVPPLSSSDGDDVASDGDDVALVPTQEVSASNEAVVDDVASASDDVSVDVVATPVEKPAKKSYDEPVKHIILLGERHSGTNWITQYLDECFGQDVKVSLSISCNVSFHGIVYGDSHDGSLIFYFLFAR